MTREHKLALIVGFSLVLLVAVVISDHLSRARQAELVAVDPAADVLPGLTIPEIVLPRELLAISKEVVQQPRIIFNQGTNGGVDRPGKETAKQVVNLPDRGRPRLGPVEPAQALVARLDPGRVAEDSGDSGLLPISEPTDNPDIRSEPTREHLVRAGDGLYKIARRYYGDGNLWPKLAEFNRDRVGEKGMIRIGVTLQIPPESVLRGPSRGRTTPERLKPLANPSPRPVILASYTVKSGDTLGEISQRFLGTVRRTSEIIKLNRLEDANNIRSGMVLTIPES